MAIQNKGDNKMDTSFQIIIRVSGKFRCCCPEPHVTGHNPVLFFFSSDLSLQNVCLFKTGVVQSNAERVVNCFYKSPGSEHVPLKQSILVHFMQFVLEC